MTPFSVFYQQCPVCGRSLRMPVQYFGRHVTCVHCGGEFRATNGAASGRSIEQVLGSPVAMGSEPVAAGAVGKS
ncbi:MAG: hypothetical protein WD872_17895 [Pirellulaceae bacterium]